MKILTHRSLVGLVPALVLVSIAPPSPAQAPAEPEAVWIASHVGTRGPSAEEALRSGAIGTARPQ